MTWFMPDICEYLQLGPSYLPVSRCATLRTFGEHSPFGHTVQTPRTRYETLGTFLQHSRTHMPLLYQALQVDGDEDIRCTASMEE